MEAFREPALPRIRRQLTTVPAAVRRGRARARATTPPAGVDGAALRDLVRGAGAEAHLVEVPVARRPWTATALRVRAGDRVTWLTWGRVYLVRPLAVGAPAGVNLLVRVGAGHPHQGTRDTMTITAERGGVVEVGGRFPGWLGEDGSVITDRVPYRAIRGGQSVVLARWPSGTDPAAALAALADRDPSGLCAAEAARLADPPAPPPGWAHHPSVPHSEVFTATPDGIAVDAPDGGGIVRRPVDVPLTPALRLRWRWRLDEPASQLPEDTALTHDYLGLACEFEDGRDLAWQWSAALPAGFAYRCPMDYWRRVETHVIARTGDADLGRWVDDERPVLADHRAAIGGPAPARVTHVWLIAVSLHQGGRVRGGFDSVELVDGDTATAVL